MNQRIKNWLGYAGIFGIIVVAIAATSYAGSFGRSVEPSLTYRNFTVTGEAKEYAVPDVAEFSFSVITQGGTDVGSLQTQNTNSTNKAIAFVKSQGVAAADIQTTLYDVEPRQQTYSCPILPVEPVGPIFNTGSGVISDGANGGASVPGIAPAPTTVAPCPLSQIVGYTITQTVDVKIRDFTKISAILGGVVKNGANSVSSLNFTLDDPSQIETKARGEAIQQAAQQAQALAKAGGFTLGPLISINDNGGVGFYAPQALNAASGAATVGASAPVTPTIEPGSQEIDANVTLEYEIQ